jgi:hypothetical protein
MKKENGGKKMKRKLFLIATLSFIALAFFALKVYAYRTSYVYVSAFYEGKGSSVSNFDVHIYDSHRFNPNRLMRAGSADGKKYFIKLAVGKVYFVNCKKGNWSGGTSFRVENRWNNYVKVRMQDYGSKAGW